jgi:L-fuculose-phosphate aldolase
VTPSPREIIRWGKLLFERRLVSGWGGNLSCRNGKKGFLITGQHTPLGFLTAKDIVRIDSQGNAIEKNRRASSETPMHLAVYRGTDAQAIVHAHPPMVLAFSLNHDRFVPVSAEEKYTIGDVPAIAQDTPTMTRPEKLVEELKYRPIIIIKGHGTVAIGKDFQEAFLVTDLLEEAVRCRFFQNPTRRDSTFSTADNNGTVNDPSTLKDQKYPLFSREHMDALVKSANLDSRFRRLATEAALTTSLTLHLQECDRFWTVHFTSGEITGLDTQTDGEFLISGKQEWWKAVFTNRIDPFLATRQGKLKLERGELSKLAQWEQPFQRAFSLWQTIPIQ